MRGWKPQSNHGRVETKITMGGWKPQESGNYLFTIGGWKLQSHHGRVETKITMGGWKPWSHHIDKYTTSH